MKKELIVLTLLILLVACTKPRYESTQHEYAPSAQQPAQPQRANVLETSPLAQEDVVQQKSTPPTNPAIVNIGIKNFAFDPPTITVKAGTTVRWTNYDSAPHTATGQGFDTGTLNKGQSGTATFSNPGSYEYRCSFHPNMKGRIIVQ